MLNQISSFSGPVDVFLNLFHLAITKTYIAANGRVPENYQLTGANHLPIIHLGYIWNDK